MLPTAVDAVDAFCETIGFTLAQTECVFNKAAQYNLPIKCHAEQLSDTSGAAMSAMHNAISVDYLEYLSTADVKKISQTNTIAVLLPGAFYILKETKPPIQALCEHSVSIALATDANPGSSPIFSPLLIMNMAYTLFAMTPLEALAGFTINAAKALEMQNTIGSIESGKQASLVLWNCQHPAELSYNVCLNPCHRVMQSGNWP